MNISQVVLGGLLMAVGFFAIHLGVVFAQGVTTNISIQVLTPVPQFSLSSPGVGELEVYWNWDFVSLGFYPAAVTEMRIELSTDGFNYGNLQVQSAGDFLSAYSGLPSGNYMARVSVIDGNDYDYVVGPITVGNPSTGGGRRNNPSATNTTDLTVTGLAYPGPSAVVIFTYNAGFETTIIPNGQGAFSYQTTSLPVGAGVLAFSAQDPDGRLSQPVTVNYTLVGGTSAVLDQVYLPPTITLGTSVATLGELVQVGGYGYRSGGISLAVDGPESRAYLVVADSDGAWSASLDTTDLGPGTYNLTAESTTADGQITSPVSEALVLQLVLAAPAAPVCGNGLIEAPEQCDDRNVQSGDGCSNLCLIEGVLPQSQIEQPTPSVLLEEPVHLNYSVTDTESVLDFVEVYYSRNGAPYVLYPGQFRSGFADLAGLPDGDYEVYSVAVANGPFEELPPVVADATFVIDRVVELNVIGYPEKRFPSQGNWSLPVRLNLYNAGTANLVSSFNLTTDDQGRVSIPTDTLPQGDYKFVLKGLSHLSKRIDVLNYRGVDLLVDFTFGGAAYLLGGDVHASKDDYVNGLDLSALVLRLYSPFADADLNKDSYVNALDLSIVVKNLFLFGDGV